MISDEYEYEYEWKRQGTRMDDGRLKLNHQSSVGVLRSLYSTHDYYYSAQHTSILWPGSIMESTFN